MNKLNLCLHSGAQSIDREQLADVFTPDGTATWQPIPHTLLLNEVENALNGTGLKVVNEAHGVTKDGNRYFGMLQLANGHTDDDFGLVVGLRNSNDLKFPAGLVVGAGVFVCDNLSFSGEIKLARKHTRFIIRDLPSLVCTAIGKVANLRNTQEHRFNTYRNTEATDAQVHDLVVRALDAQVLPVTHIPHVLKEWREPRHPEFINAGKTLWRFFNAITEVAKGTNLEMLPNRTIRLHGILDAQCGLLIPQQPATELQTAQAI